MWGKSAGQAIQAKRSYRRSWWKLDVFGRSSLGLQVPAASSYATGESINNMTQPVHVERSIPISNLQSIITTIRAKMTTPSPQPLAGKLAIITGASRGKPLRRL
jgi:hypothetical protein